MDHTPETPTYTWQDYVAEVGAEIASSLTPVQIDRMGTAISYHIRNFVEMPEPAVATEQESSEQ
jgi:hypothetical protein